MDLSVYLSVQGWSEDFAFDDVAQLNAELMRTGIGRHDEARKGLGRLFACDGGKVGLVDLGSGREGDGISIRFDGDMFDVVAGHVACGWLVLGLDPEDSGPVFFRMNPEGHEMVRPANGWVAV